MNRKKLLIAAVIVIAISALVYANLNLKRTPGVEVNVEKIALRDLEAIVSASGRIQPKKSVNISAETMGKVTELTVSEGDTVRAGQPLLQIDPRNLATNVQNREASLATARSQLEETKRGMANANLAIKQAEDDFRRQKELWSGGLTTREAYERAESTLKMRQADLSQREQSIQTMETRINQEEALLTSARYDLNKVHIISPISGIVTRRNIEEGETVVIGTMNNAGTVLLTIADMSVIEAEVEVDETDIPFIAMGQVASVTIDAFGEKKFPAKVTEVGNSPIQTTAGGARQATNFKVVVTIEGVVPDVRPGFTCTAVITTATRQKAVSVPIQATAVRELIFDAKGERVLPPAPAPGAKAAAKARPGVTATAELGPGQTRKETEGVFVVTDGKAVFTPIKVGIAGEKYFEVLAGLKDGTEVITGPFASVRTLKDGDAVKIGTAPAAAAKNAK